jgi:UDP-N-acetylmuramoylalanine--D-glutamate ligase
MNATCFRFTATKFLPTKREAHFAYAVRFSDGVEHVFTERIILPFPPNTPDIPGSLLKRILRDVHFMLGVSYFKLYAPQVLDIPYALTENEARFWTTVYRKGLGEFFYRNGLDPEIFTGFYATKGVARKPIEWPRKDRALLGIGGGKDSILAAELLKEEQYDTTAFIVETGKPSRLIRSVSDAIKFPQCFIHRVLDEQLLAGLPGNFQGHMPISGVYAFLGILAALLYDFRYMIVGNEYSSNFGNIDNRGEVINHQWSKSVEFESLLQQYLRENITKDIVYFSLLRPFYELRVTKMFAEYPQYFSIFSSCNRNFAIRVETPDNRWCGKCAKCAFMFALLSAFLPKNTVVGIFGRNLFAQADLIPLYRDLAGIGGPKPFDCVGMFEETRAALRRASLYFPEDAVIKSVLPELPEEVTEEVNLLSAQRSFTVPSRFRFLGMRNALILGYGREGKATERFLQKNYPKLNLGIADLSEDLAYLDDQDRYDIAVKTPGIPKDQTRIHYTTATNIFLSRIQNQVIGITGTKGKSTTAKLITDILAVSGEDVRLLGNIGEPMLDALQTDIKKDTIFVLELSSYQLDDIELSPHIAVVLNLFIDHLPYHGSFDAYAEAKKRIIEFQRPNDVFFYNGRDTKVAAWALDARGISISFEEEEITVPESAIPLLGRHNRENIRAAVAIARHMGISESVIRRAIMCFQPLPHRLELVAECRGIRFYDDALATTPEATVAALEAIPDVRTVFLGGEDRGYDFSILEHALREAGVMNIVLFPVTGGRILSSREGFKVIETASMKEAIEFAYSSTPAGGACLLSTASPSFSLWNDYEEKAAQYRDAIMKGCNAAKEGAWFKM